MTSSDIRQHEDQAAVASSAADKLLGYSLQQTRMLIHLLDSKPGDIVFLEHLGDVARLSSDGRLTTEEDKSNLASNPLSDTAESLWKTFYNWCRACKDGHMAVGKSVFVLYVANPAHGAIVQSFAAADSPDRAKKACSHAKRVLDGSRHGRVAGQLPASIEKYVQYLYHANNKAIFTAIIQRFYLEVADGNLYSDVLRRISDIFFFTEAEMVLAEQAMHECLGFIKATTDQQIASRIPAHIRATQFAIRLRGIMMLRPVQELSRSEYTATPAEIVAHLSSKTFVRQLDLISYDPDGKTEAVVAFLQAAHQRTAWAQSGEVPDFGRKTYEQDLRTTWRIRKREAGLVHRGRDECDIGTAVLLSCIDPARGPKLTTREVPPSFLEGSYHALADKCVVGWHPRYSEELNRQFGICSPPNDSEGGEHE